MLKCANTRQSISYSASPSWLKGFLIPINLRKKKSAFVALAGECNLGNVPRCRRHPFRVQVCVKWDYVKCQARLIYRATVATTVTLQSTAVFLHLLLPCSHTSFILHHFISSCTVSPLVERFAFPKNLTRGKRLRVICTVTDGDVPLQVEWWKDGLRIGGGGIGGSDGKFGSQGVQVRRIDEFTSLLAISFLETTHAGNYSCVASNSVATYSRSATLTIRGEFVVSSPTDKWRPGPKKCAPEQCNSS